MSICIFKSLYGVDVIFLLFFKDRLFILSKTILLNKSNNLNLT